MVKRRGVGKPADIYGIGNLLLQWKNVYKP